MGLPQRIAAKSVSAEKLKMSEDRRGTHSRHLKIVGGQDMSSFSTDCPGFGVLHPLMYVKNLNEQKQLDKMKTPNKIY